MPDTRLAPPISDTVQPDTIIRRLTEGAVVLLIAAGVAGVFVMDTMLPLGTAIWLIYLLPLVVSYASGRAWLPPATAGVLILALALGFHFAPAGIDPRVAILNRTLAGAMILVLGGVGHVLIRSRIAAARADRLRAAEIALAQALQGDHDPARLADRALHTLAAMTGARAGVAYQREGAGLARIAAWGTDPAALPARVPPGEGHLWRALHEDRIIAIEGERPDALGWGSALMSGRAPHSLILPLREGGHPGGVIELGFAGPPGDEVLDLLDRAAEPVGIALRSARYRGELQSLLEETRRQAEALRAHGEELAATNEELEEQTRALAESERRLSAQQVELEQQNAQLEDQTQQLEEQRDALAESRRQLLEQAEQLARESRYKSEFVANMSHELRTPLNALLIMARLLAENRRGNLDAEQVRWAETIESSGQDLLVLINDILDLAKIEAGRLEVASEPVLPATVATRLMRKFEVEARTRGLALAAELAPGLPEIRTDPGRLEQVLRNFLSNAMKFTERGRVTLSVQPRGAEIAFAVRDTGIGIAPAEQGAIFEPFRQADGTISRRYGGTGLGLSISRELAQLLGGRIEVESTPGQGSTFTLLVPREPAQAAQGGQAAAAQPAAGPGVPVKPAPTPAAPARGPSHGPTARPEGMPGALGGVADDRDRITDGDRVILVVEDDPAFARIVVDLAHETGFCAVVVGTADDAIRAAHRWPPQAIVLDIGLPDHTGLTVLDRLKRDVATRHIPVHVVSAEDLTHEALSQGAMSYLVKPVDRQALVRLITDPDGRAQAAPRRVLIVEDDPAQRDGLCALLRSDRVETQAAASAAEALAAFRARRPDCIVLDLTLPDASGLELLEALRAEAAADAPGAAGPAPVPVPVIVYTARTLDPDEELALRRHSRSIIIKGAKSPERLIDEVTLFLHQVVSDLPARQREMLAASLSRDTMLEGRRILIVEDDIRNVYALTGIFEPHGAEVLIARNGREALEVLGRAADGGGPGVDLVLMDVMMPEMDGLTATREIRRLERWRTLPIIMLTAKAMADDQGRCLDAGANDYLSKPIDVGKLLSLARVWMPR